MSQWLQIVKSANNKLGGIAQDVLDKSAESVANMVARMLVVEPKARITAGSLFSELRLL
ncbi:hypothetical protein ACQKWADRAFT_307824 [Trichoderma austrokoningii]